MAGIFVLLCALTAFTLYVWIADAESPGTVLAGALAGALDRLTIFRDAAVAQFGPGCFAVATIMFFWLVWFDPEARTYHTNVSDVILSAGSTAITVAFVLWPEAKRYLCADGGPPWLSDNVELTCGALLPLGGESALSDGYATLGVVLAGLSAGFIIKASAGPVEELVRRIFEILNWTSNQIHAARRLRQPAMSAIPARSSLSRMYEKEVRIDRQSRKRGFPSVTGPGERARIKLMIYNARADAVGEDFSLTLLRGLLTSAEIEINQSLFFVCAVDAKNVETVVCYGTGHELIELLDEREAEHEHPESGSLGERFCDALTRNDKEEVVKVVNDARKMFLHHYPHPDVLLSTVTQKDTDELQKVLAAMAENGLSRILIVSDFVPVERGILGAAEISKFLLPSPLVRAPH